MKRPTCNSNMDPARRLLAAVALRAVFDVRRGGPHTRNHAAHFMQECPDFVAFYSGVPLSRIEAMAKSTISPTTTGATHA